MARCARPEPLFTRLFQSQQNKMTFKRRCLIDKELFDGQAANKSLNGCIGMTLDFDMVAVVHDFIKASPTILYLEYQ